MKKMIVFLFTTIILMSCDNDCANPNKYTYNPMNGKCEKCNGEEGYNSLDYNHIRSTKNAECTDLSNLNLVYLLDTVAIDNFTELGYNILQDYNFKGCKFDTSILFFNHIYGASFEGADLSNLSYGYAVVTGKIDEFTILPVTGVCHTIADSCDCAQ
jgi:hypothetical protein